jgi:hypothetical protein
MRLSLALCAVLASGCANTVYRIKGEATTPGGEARTPCESREWLVIAPTRAEVASAETGKSHPENGVGLYKVGSNDPVDVTSVERLRSEPLVIEKDEELSPYRTRQWIAGGLGTAGVIAIAVGTGLFVSAFETTRTRDPLSGQTKEDNTVNGGTAAAGGITVGLGFALGISGLVVNPSHAQRTQANATRYTFLPPTDPKRVESLVEKHNSDVRTQCENAPAGQ